MDNEQQKKTVLRKIFSKVWNKTDSNKVLKGILDKINDVIDKLPNLDWIDFVKPTGVSFYNKALQVAQIPPSIIPTTYINGSLEISSNKNSLIKIYYDTINIWDNDPNSRNSLMIDTKYISKYTDEDSEYGMRYVDIDIYKLAKFINNLQSTMALSADEELTDDNKVVTIRELTQEEIDELKQRENNVERKENE